MRMKLINNLRLKLNKYKFKNKIKFFKIIYNFLFLLKFHLIDNKKLWKF
jgi:hypothetical protein